MEFHLLVLVHGLWGNKSHFDYINQEIDKMSFQCDEELVVYRTEGNEGYKTLDGIDVCGLRVSREITDKITQLDKEGKVVKLSVVGYSLGGLISRYAIGILYHQGVFNDIRPMNFTTFCTPHVGSLTPGSNITVKMFNWLVPNLLSSSGKQMFLKDNDHESPLLLLMAAPSTVFYRALQLFQYRSLYANAINDKRTAWWTAGIAVVDPFIKIDESTSLENLDFKFVEDYDPIVIDSHAPFTISSRPVITTAVPMLRGSSSVTNFWGRKYRWIVVAFNLVFFMPLWALWFILSGILESIKSHQRIRAMLNESNAFLADLASVVLAEDDAFDNDDKSLERLDRDMDQVVQDRADTLMESVWDAITSKDDEESARLSQLEITTGELTPAESSHGAVRSSITDLSYFSPDSTNAENDVLRHFTLELSPTQLEIIRRLNDLQWEKFPILIRYTKSTHSAAIVRNLGDSDLVEGKTVVKHWLCNVFHVS